MNRRKSDLDMIKILGLTATGRHGVYAFERREGQQFTVDVIMYVDTRGAARGDDLSQTVDYSEVAADVNAVLAGPPVFLIETLAQKVAQVVLKYEAVQIVQVVVHKPHAPMDLEFSDVSMTITRTRQSSFEPGSSASEAKSQINVQETLEEKAPGKRSARRSVQEPTGAQEGEVKPPRRTRSARHEAKRAAAFELAQKFETTSTREPKPVDSPVHAQMMSVAMARAERAQWLAEHSEQLEKDLQNPACTPIAQSMQGWRVGDPRPAPNSIKPPVTSPLSPLHAVLVNSFVDHEGLTKAPQEPVTAVISLGANVGSASKTLAEAILMLDAMPDISVTGVSALFCSAPVLAPGQEAQSDYYNAVVQVSTTLAPLDLLNATQMIENAFGRVRTEHWGPRTLDLDIITYGSLRSDDPKLTLPHPRAHERAFVLLPWLQIDPNARVGRYGRADILVRETADQEIEQVATSWVEDAARKPDSGEGDKAIQNDATAPVGRVYRRRASASAPGGAVFTPKAKPRWMPLPPRDKSQPKSDPAPAPQEEAQTSSSGSAPATGQSQVWPDTTRHTKPIIGRKIALPRWHRSAEQRIIDDPDELHRADEDQQKSTSAQKPRVESGLAEDFASGLIPLTQEPARPSRRTIVRPTVTGAIPIVKRRDKNETP
ncbi:2-amino-4-hydroxy-6-hydroxymethyldihydropteridine diphosphokinase [Actinomyces urinae]|uniref:2-amino-4-hydroxy-6- hydroxymethyldihydropteridine diphosphokinase n=1 Tax=Actinomyces urinae TaxID=1689268 RepID=UPI000930B962|nr:2-amino-4-hydroxy-6-hydroxymethyldihydropteridine diphosphokinase [Actinomyces urinae]